VKVGRLKHPGKRRQRSLAPSTTPRSVEAALDLVRTFDLEPAPAKGAEKRHG
jgi:hypothetical protein